MNPKFNRRTIVVGGITTASSPHDPIGFYEVGDSILSDGEYGVVVEVNGDPRRERYYVTARFWPYDTAAANKLRVLIYRTVKEEYLRERMMDHLHTVQEENRQVEEELQRVIESRFKSVETTDSRTVDLSC